MRTGKLSITYRLRPKVLLAPRKNNFDKASNKTVDQLIAALKVPTTERTDQDVDTLLSTVGTWPSFANAVHGEQMRREVCRQMVYQPMEANMILFKEGDPPNGWFIIVTGQCLVVKFAPDESGMADMPPIMIQKLREGIPNRFYKTVFTAGPKCEFGAVALINNKPRNATIYVSQPSILIRVDNQIYKDTAAFFTRTQLQKRTNLYSHVKEFDILKDVREGEQNQTIRNLAENTVDFTIPSGTIIDKQHTASITEIDKTNLSQLNEKALKEHLENERLKTQSFYIIAEGKLTVHRYINFSDYKATKKDENTDDVLSVRIPSGQHLIQIGKLGPKMMFPDPRLEGGWITQPCILKVIEPVLLHRLKLNDLSSSVPQAKLDIIKEKVREQPDDQIIIEDWIEKQRQAQWLTFKKQCIKEAQRVIKLEREIMNGEYGMRKAGPPKAIKAHDPFPPLRRSALRDLISIEEEKKRAREKEKAIEQKKLMEMRKTVELRVQTEMKKSNEMKERQEQLKQQRQLELIERSKQIKSDEEERLKQREEFVQSRIQEELKRSQQMAEEKARKEQEKIERLEAEKQRTMRYESKFRVKDQERYESISKRVKSEMCKSRRMKQEDEERGSKILRDVLDFEKKQKNTNQSPQNERKHSIQFFEKVNA